MRSLTLRILGRPCLLIILSIVGSSPALAQRAPTTPVSPGGGSGIGTAGNTASVPSSTSSIPATSYPAQTTFLSGAVLFDDGMKPNTDIVVELVCRGTPHPQGHTDSKGHFSFQVGQNPEAIDVQDASVGSYGGTLGPNSAPGSGIQRTTDASDVDRNGRGIDGTANRLFGCEVRARYPGYRSDSVDLGIHHSLDNPNVGTIILHRLTNVSGTTISATTAEALKPAVKDYEKGEQLVKKGKMDDAEKRFEQAVNIYPQYAVAWFALGDVQRSEGHLEAAAASYKSAIASDVKYVSPYDRLALMAFQSSNWKDAESYSKQAITLNPVEFPTSFLYNAVAALNLNENAEAEQSARALLKTDTANQFPDAEAVLAQALLAEGKYADAATHIRSYLAHYPDSREAPALKQALAKIDPSSAVAKE